MGIGGRVTGMGKVRNTRGLAFVVQPGFLQLWSRPHRQALLAPSTQTRSQACPETLLSTALRRSWQSGVVPVEAEELERQKQRLVLS